MKINVNHVAKLANLPLRPDEEKKFENQLSEILSYFEQLNEVNTEKIEETSQVTGLENVIREDKIAESLTQNEAVSGTKSQQNGLFRVNAILDNHEV
jgi:aspartyl-tRNA(Asn)/glutamyl-tRNA(Gln) amidotransferase subunit C